MRINSLGGYRSVSVTWPGPSQLQSVHWPKIHPAAAWENRVQVSDDGSCYFSCTMSWANKHALTDIFHSMEKQLKVCMMQHQHWCIFHCWPEAVSAHLSSLLSSISLISSLSTNSERRIPLATVRPIDHTVKILGVRVFFSSFYDA